MRRWDLPERYDFENPAGDEDAQMARNPQGDYVEFDTYQELYEAFEKLQNAMADIVVLAGNAEREASK